MLYQIIHIHSNHSKDHFFNEPSDYTPVAKKGNLKIEKGNLEKPVYADVCEGTVMISASQTSPNM